ncbi:MAG: DUF917 family protein [Clostridia bacterium]|nr:DUF917 family protein [Clostridia bacterium]
MAEIMLNQGMIEPAAIGGCFLGGGGGGAINEGKKLATLAVQFSSPKLVDVQDIKDDAVLVNVAAVGAPSAQDAYAEPVDYVRAIKLIEQLSGTKIDAIMSNEAGGLATLNGWLQASMLGIPLVDVSCNGRAHPTSVMGAMGLHKLADYRAIQVGVGGSKQDGNYIEVVSIGSVQKCSNIIRSAAVNAGGLVAVARNPVSKRYAANNGAVGSIKQAIEIGRRMIDSKEKGLGYTAKSVCDYLGGEIIGKFHIESINLESKGGFDVGWLGLSDQVQITFWNEYMTLEKEGQRIATFPDLIALIDEKDCLPITSAEAEVGQNVVVIKVSKDNLKLGKGMYDPDLFKVCEQAINKQIIKYIF